MRVGLSGWGGFLASKLRENTEIEWVNGVDNIDAFLHLGSPTFTAHELFEHDAQVMHQYVRESIKMIDRINVPFVFASTTGVDDIQLDHRGSTAYNLGKLYLENYVINECDKYLVLRIGTVVSSKKADVLAMKSDRIQQRILNKDYSNIPTKDYYLDVDDFVNVTVAALQKIDNRIVDYPLKELSMPALASLAK
jgi:nucleoside-diphosphate-sugar epimerase